MQCLACIGPTDDPTVIDKVDDVFPGALKSETLAAKVHNILSRNGYNSSTTLLATSLCCDEVNRELERDLTNIYTQNFSMGGLAGFAFGGVTSFGAMSHHIPDGGSCLVVYGPHVGVDSSGVVGKVDRRGRAASGTCCGSAAAAAGYVKSVCESNAKEAGPPTDPIDAQQSFVGNMLLPQGERLVGAEDPDVELPLALFDVQNEFMNNIVQKGCGEVAGNGKIALLGGIQINTPAGTSEYFLPKVFVVLNNKGEQVADLIKELK